MQSVADFLMERNPLLQQACGFRKPGPYHRLTVASGTEGDNGLEFFHPINHCAGPKSTPHPVAAERLHFGGPDDDDNAFQGVGVGPHVRVAVSRVKEPQKKVHRGSEWHCACSPDAQYR